MSLITNKPQFTSMYSFKTLLQSVSVLYYHTKWKEILDICFSMAFLYMGVELYIVRKEVALCKKGKPCFWCYIGCDVSGNQLYLMTKKPVSEKCISTSHHLKNEQEQESPMATQATRWPTLPTTILLHLFISYIHQILHLKRIRRYTTVHFVHEASQLFNLSSCTPCS